MYAMYAQTDHLCKKFGMTLENRNIYSQQTWCAPKYDNPMWNNAYIKILAYLDEHEDIEMKECLRHVFGRFVNFDIFKTLVNFGFIDKTDPNVKRHVKFHTTKYGKMLLEEATYSKNACELMDFAKKVKAKSAEEFIVQMTLEGKAHLQSTEFIADVIETFEEHPVCERRVYRAIPFFDEFVKIINER